MQSEPTTDQVQPIEWVQEKGIWLKRDDLFEIGGARGGKARACWGLIQEGIAQGTKGLITVGAADSPQMQIVARLAKKAGLACRCHTAFGKSPIKDDARAHGAEIVEHKPGYESVIKCRAREDKERNPSWTLIPFGMEGTTAVEYTRRQVRDIPPDVKRIVICVGGGMSAAGVLLGLEDAGLDIPVVGIRVGHDPTDTLDKQVPNWRERERMTLVRHPYVYQTAVDETIAGIRLDPIYDAKCVRYLQPGDLFWVVGIRSKETVDAALAEWRNKKPRLAKDKPAKAKGPTRAPAPPQAAEGGEEGTTVPSNSTELLTRQQVANVKKIQSFLGGMSADEAEQYRQLIDDARACADRFDTHQRQAIHAAKECGDFLHKIKAMLPYGTWCEWLKLNHKRIGVKQGMVNVYMAISREWETIEPELAANPKLTIEACRAMFRKRNFRDDEEEKEEPVFYSLVGVQRMHMLGEIQKLIISAPDEQIKAMYAIAPDIVEAIDGLSKLRMGVDKMVGHYQSHEYRMCCTGRYKLHWRIVEIPGANPDNTPADNWDECDSPGEFLHFEPVPAPVMPLCVTPDPKPEPIVETTAAEATPGADEWDDWDMYDRPAPEPKPEPACKAAREEVERLGRFHHPAHLSRPELPWTPTSIAFDSDWPPLHPGAFDRPHAGRHRLGKISMAALEAVRNATHANTDAVACGLMPVLDSGG